jgi:hypothetical protein
MGEKDSEEPVDRSELLANIRRLTIAVLDNLEQGSRENTLDQGEKRLLSSTGTRLLRLWRSTLKDGSTNETGDKVRRKSVLLEESSRGSGQT